MEKLILILTLLAGVPVLAMAHSGGTDAMGCHVDHRTGIRHCH